MKVQLTDPGAEMRYLGACLHRPETLYEHPLPVADMSGKLTAAALAAMLGLVGRREDVSTFAVQAELERVGIPRQAAIDFTLTMTNTVEFAPIPVVKRLRELGEIRRMREQAAAIVQAADTGSLDATREARGAMIVADDSHADPDVRVLSWAEVIDRTESTITKLGTEDDRSARLGGRIVDQWVHLAPGSLTVIGAGTNVGKTTYLVDCALDMTFVHGPDEVHPARHHVTPVGLISCEDPAEGIGSKGVAHDAAVNSGELWKMGNGRMSQADLARVFEIARKRRNRPIFLTELKGGRVEDVITAMRRMRHQHRIECVMIDYLQAIRGRPGGARDPRQRIDEVLAEIMAAASVLDLPLILASQLSRPEKGSPFRERHLSDLKESGTIENRSQNVILLWRKSDKPGAIVHGKVAKTKNQPAGVRFDLVRNEITGQLIERPAGSSTPERDPQDDPWGAD